jgi:protein SCO1/2
VEGTVVQRNGTHEVVLDHEAIDGLMGPMVMPFKVRDPDLITALEPGDRVLARFEVAEEGGYLTKVRVTGRGPAPAYEEGPAPLKPGQVLPSTRVELEDGTSIVLGQGQDRPTVVTFLYTRCPIPEFCPATVARFQALQEAVGPDIRLLAITLDPDFDTPAVLSEFALQSGARPEIWRFGRASSLDELAFAAGMSVDRSSGQILHGIRVLVLSAEGALITRHDDHTWSIASVLSDLQR